MNNEKDDEENEITNRVGFAYNPKAEAVYISKQGLDALPIAIEAVLTSVRKFNAKVKPCPECRIMDTFKQFKKEDMKGLIYGIATAFAMSPTLALSEPAMFMYFCHAVELHDREDADEFWADVINAE